MKHLIISREYPPATYARGGIAAYLERIVALLVSRDEIVHVIGELWDGAPLARQELEGGRLVVHRVPMGGPAEPGAPPGFDDGTRILESMADSAFPAQAFSWQAALRAEALIEREGIDIIEAQDYEAPLYYFLLRRATGLGPARQPPCFVHLHSPWEFVLHANGWGLASEYDAAIVRQETHAILAADALLCPSDFLANQVESHYGLDRRTVERIPYPVGETKWLDRSRDVWSNGTICYFGRTEPRKGVLEWIRAAMLVASERPELRFELIGADTSLTGERESSVRSVLEAAVPEAQRPAFTFSGALDRGALQERLARARIVVVPSRWENFPLACIEAMSSGVPVLASPNGGMVDMVRDGRTGWIARSGHPDDLAAALRRALGTTPEGLAAMGRQAAADIRELCDNSETFERQMAFRERVVAQGAARSRRLPRIPAWTPPPVSSATARTPARPPAAPRGTSGSQRHGLGVVINAIGADAEDLKACLSSVERQTRPAEEIAIVTDRPMADLPAAARGLLLVEPGLSPDGARGRGLQRLSDRERPLAGVVFIDPGCRLHPDFSAITLSVLDGNPAVGIVSPWHMRRSRSAVVGIHESPLLPYQWLQDDVSECAVFRMEALESLEWRQAAGIDLPANGDLSLALLLDDWIAVTCPAVLSRRTAAAAAPSAFDSTGRERLRLELLRRYAGATAAHAPLLVHLLQSREGGIGEASGLPRQTGRGSLSPATILKLPPSDQLALVMRALRNPRYAASWLSRLGHRRLNDLVERLRSEETS